MRSAVSLLLLLAAFAALTLWRAGAREAQAEAAYPPEGEFVTVEGVRLHAVVAGDGPDLVLIHGASASVRDFTFALMPKLAERYRVIAVDRPGHGWSEPAPGGESIHEQARLIRAAAAELGADRPIVLGHSYGGAVALAWAVDAPGTLAALVTVSAPSHRWGTPLPRLYRITGHPVLGAITRPLLTAWLPDRVVTSALESAFAPQAMPEGYGAHFGPRMSLRRGTLRENARQRGILKDELTRLSVRYPEIGVPVEQIHGDADTTVSLSIHAEALARDVPGAHLTRLPGIGHAPHQVAIPAVAAAVDRAAARAGLR
ncbi:Dihydrolipoyllysine-residue acetyltransferase component of acetoin cleaving system [Defluviimonas aquaemixtae]|uniref:Dihydrolipoyllysine-residue acetyltransferase component of acetoin cleaving system n=1 Tax=Albidovulum aquaemixtae TaxID=1542388 RepID=A0A2R8B5E5_9RHOB|nr:alpha/beta hydrolase [Defluviimonas aquaemixtae]SPH17753.1 Dihydrolipoyllysine-residue acetyltransferase component of acetoin cleaving system [Defluviimonas aquaemixtae]